MKLGKYIRNQTDVIAGPFEKTTGEGFSLSKGMAERRLANFEEIHGLLFFKMAQNFLKNDLRDRMVIALKISLRP